MNTFFYISSTNTKIESSTIDATLAASNYWEPKYKSYHVGGSGEFAIGLASLPLNPFENYNLQYSNDKNIIVSSNALLSNRNEMVQVLNARSNISDGDLINLAYKKWGTQCLDRFKGEFSFVLVDLKSQLVFFATDHFGVRSTLYSEGKYGVMVSNEPAAFLSSGWIEPSVDEEHLINNICINYHHPTSSLYKEIEKLPPSHFAVAKFGEPITVKPYWNFSDSLVNGNDQDILDRYRKSLKSAVISRLKTDQQIGAELSEGLDSTGIVGIAATAFTNKVIYTFSHLCQRPNDANREEWQKAHNPILNFLKLHTNLNPVWTEKSVFAGKEELDRFVKCLGGTYAIPESFLLRKKLMKEKGIRILLSGFGGDHCASSQGFNFLSDLFQKRDFSAINKHLRSSNRPLVKNYLLLIFQHQFPTLFYQYSSYRGSTIPSHLRKEAKYRLIKKSLYNKYDIRKKLTLQLSFHHQKTLKGLHERKLRRNDLEQRLFYTELSARFYGMEARFPLLDLDLVHQAYNMPNHLIVNGQVNRYHFRKAIEGYVTNDILWHKKSDIVRPPLISKDELCDRAYKVLRDEALLNNYCDSERILKERKLTFETAKQICFIAPYFRFFRKNNLL
ncbi:asparagine synthase-related protein [Marinomonas mediterranea]|jgi:Asparagine synthase (glutamine-hydrolyzing)|uniref:asparagine synthase (glutamine-hydrolyzing) n=1 Tax=Marinomonas mediterranea (strain ATCC 700492 / JCM 21426 / NBRC 103028 / MMB-1) TaxID=717774 RepID=F2JVI4_MARM1|nr:asparagine synthase-related protein [Marinomonas mediterranea]ADZ90528.1 asparagine synthase [Marinomonas mediterranea MMB-1]WCN16707.1 asparagine synthase [Marinomonas mediterranea MMB-1]